jgi:hypothetical protein
MSVKRTAGNSETSLVDTSFHAGVFLGIFFYFVNRDGIPPKLWFICQYLKPIEHVNMDPRAMNFTEHL